jgi:hypothetical protein
LLPCWQLEQKGHQQQHQVERLAPAKQRPSSLNLHQHERQQRFLPLSLFSYAIGTFFW